MSSVFTAVVFGLAFALFAVSFVVMNLHDFARRKASGFRPQAEAQEKKC